MILSTRSDVLWVHVTFSWLYMVLGFILIWHFTRKNQYSEADYVIWKKNALINLTLYNKLLFKTSRTVLITNYPKDCRNEEVIHKHFEYFSFFLFIFLNYVNYVSKLCINLNYLKRSLPRVENTWYSICLQYKQTNRAWKTIVILI